MDNITKPLKVKKIHFKGSDNQLEDCTIIMIAGFIVVDTEKEGALPNWYNKDTIEMLEGVEPVKGNSSGKRYFI